MGNYSHSGYLTGKANKNEMNISSSFDLALGNTALNLIALPTYYFTSRHKQVTKTVFSMLFDEVENCIVFSHPQFFFPFSFFVFFSFWVHNLNRKDFTQALIWFSRFLVGNSYSRYFASIGAYGAILSNYFWHFAHQIVSFFKGTKWQEASFRAIVDRVWILLSWKQASSCHWIYS